MQVDYSEEGQPQQAAFQSVLPDLRPNLYLVTRTLQILVERKALASDSPQVESIETILEELGRKSPSENLERQHRALIQTLSNVLIASTSETCINILRLLPHEVLLRPVVQNLLAHDLIEVMPALCDLLQYTNAFNYAILNKVRQEQSKTQFFVATMLEQLDIDIAKALIKGIQAQPYLIELINAAPLFTPEAVAIGSSDHLNDFAMLLTHLRSLILPAFKTPQTESKANRNSRLTLVQSLLLNKRAEANAKHNVEKALCDSVIEVVDQEEVSTMVGANDKVLLGDDSVVATTPYVMKKVQSILSEIEERPFGHFALHGPAGSGKMTLIRLADQLLAQRYQNTSEPQTSRFIVVTLEETFDSKNLVGTYVCNETGEFVFKKGPLTVAAEQGLWLVLRNIEDTPSDLLSFLLPLIEQNTLQVTSTFAIKPKLGFRIFALTRSAATKDSSFASTAEEAIAPLVTLLTQTELESLMPEQGREDLESILQVKFAPLFAATQIGGNIHTLLQQAISYLSSRFSQLKLHLLDFKPASVTQMFSLYERINRGLGDYLAESAKDDDAKPAFLSQSQRQLIIEELHDVYLAYLYDLQVKKNLIKDLIGAVFNTAEDSMLDGQLIADFITDVGREHGSSNEQCFFGRATLSRTITDTDDENLDAQQQQTSKFVYTGSTVRSLEQICQAVSLNEALLLVGETGTGKTTVVQELAKKVGKTLHVFNMNQNTDSADLLGGFKSVDLKYLLTPVYRLFLEVFGALLNAQATNNAKFKSLMQKCFELNQVKEFIQCLKHGLKSINRSKKERTDDLLIKIESLERQTSDLDKRAKKLVGGGGFIFQFVEGTLIKSIQEGDWILLDEINLASDSVLNKLATIVQGNHILLNERADIVETKRHAEFRIFMCMNPPYSSAGKKQLPFSLRSKLTEIYVAELENEADLWDIIDRNTKSLSNELVSCLPEDQKRSILQFYKQVRVEVQRQMRRGNIGLRNLCRALFFIKSAVQLKYPPIKAIYDSLLTCFASHLDQSLQESVRQMIMKQFEIRKLPQLVLSEDDRDERFVYIEGNVIPKGANPPEQFDERNFILTPSFKNLLRQLASVVAVSNFAVILEGPTSAGKTSCVQYLAQITHNKVIRINNHMHTDVQEYLGSYVPDSQTGKLVFQEGVLVEAVRHGYWVILDELNLAPSEVLEALNRLLDDNRELHIVETQTVVKAHPRFRIFATQNPTEGYGGRKELSEAFKNRFVLIRVLDVPTEELKEILVQKCSMPPSRAGLMIRVMDQLQIYRSQANLFSGKNAIITVRDLLKWAGRVNLNAKRGNHMDPQAIAMEGFFVLGERSRNATDKQYICETIEKVFKVTIDIEEIYESYFEQNLKHVFDQVPAELNLPKIIASKQLKRLAVLVDKCLRNREPVLLVGDTGCGKTTLCQVFASEVTKQNLLQINCHQNTETSDFIGCMRTRKNLKQTQDKLAQVLQEVAQQLNVSQAVDHAQSLKRKTKIVLKELTKAKEEANNSSPEVDETISEIKALQDDLNCVFEWHDGILVEAMQEGALLLIDEISLANDSVLERLNSVFEQDRVLMVTEKSSQEAIKIVAHEKFNMVATMNPSGDFGKKELSPALRNRMTEIWVDSYFTQNELLALQKIFLIGEQTVFEQVDENIDLFLIISKLSEDASLPQEIALAIFNIINFLASFSASDSLKFQALKRKALSIRDILCIIEFLKKNRDKMELSECFRQAIELVVIDGLCLGIDTAGTAEQAAITAECKKYLALVQSKLLPSSEQVMETVVDSLVNTTELLGTSYYSMEKKPEAANIQTKFAFNAETTQTNLMKLLRAYTLDKPILIEGPPGVGKTALVEQVAKVTGRKLVRVNLSEQTDMMDLLGSEYPTSANNASNEDNTGVSDEEDQDEIQFRWGDGVLLSAIKEGHWLLIDEMNLAQQSILEGLNAILDHRRTVYIPELNKEFQCHADFFVFACQNPSQSASSTAGRKTLPKSFLNRFTKIYLNELKQEDYRVILQSIAGQFFPDSSQIDWLLKMTQEVEAMSRPNYMHELGLSINMRDLSRFIKIYENALASSGLKTESILHAFNTAYLMKEGVTDTNRQKCQAHLLKSFADELKIEQLQRTSSLRIDEEKGLIFNGLVETEVKFNSRIDQDEASTAMHGFNFADMLALKGPQALQMHSLSDCTEVDLPILITTDDPKKLIQSLNLMAGIRNVKMRRILLSDRSDTTQLLGCFEQTSQDLSQVIKQLQSFKTSIKLATPILELEQKLNAKPQDLEKQVKLVEAFIKRNSPELDHLKSQVAICKRGVSKFEWVDSVLVNAISEGEWAVFENANICNASILDRLNPLLEEGNQAMVINEQGLEDQTQQLRVVTAHPSFRAIFVLSRKSLIENGKDVSRALRNRCLELSICFDQATNETGSSDSKSIVNHIKLESLGCETIDERNFDWSLARLQTRFDLLPMGDTNTTQEQDDEPLEVTLGKRNRSEHELHSSIQIEADEHNDHESNHAYPYLFLEHAKQMAGSEGACQEICTLKEIADEDLPLQDGQQRYMRDEVVKLQSMLALNKLKREMVSKQLQPFFKSILGMPSEDCDLESMHLLIQNLMNARSLSQAFDSALCLYLASRLTNPAVRASIRESERAAEMSFLFQSDDVAMTPEGFANSLKCLGANVIGDQSLAQYLEKDLEQIVQAHNDQKLFMFKTSAKRLSDLLQKQDCHGRVTISMQMLQGRLDDEPRNATVLLLNGEKEIMSEAEMIKQLEDLDDPATILETPNLLIIPFDAASKSIQAVASSQSFLYESLCDLKDWLRVQRGMAQQATRHFRMTRIPVGSMMLQDQETSVIANQIALLARPLQAFHQSEQQHQQYEDRLIEASLIDQLTICVRDLPAFYACASSLSYKLRDVAEVRGRQEKLFKDRFDQLYAERVHQNSSQVRDNLEALDEKLQTRISSISTEDDVDDDLKDLHALAKESVTGVLQSFQLVWSLQTEQVIHALIVLPLEMTRLANSVEFANSACQSYRDFYEYHIRYLAETNRLVAPKLAKRDNLNAQMSQLEALQAQSGSNLSEKQQQQLRPLLAFTNNLLNEVRLLSEKLSSLGEDDEDREAETLQSVRERCTTIIGLLDSSTHMLFPMFNHVVADLFAGCLNLVMNARHLCIALHCSRNKIYPSKGIAQTVINLQPGSKRLTQTMLNGILRTTKMSGQKELNEKTLLWALKLCKLQGREENEQRAISHIFDYFVRREVARKMAEERAANEIKEKTFEVPFKVRNQDLPEFVGKAMDEWTKEDVARWEAEAEQEIETNFPSYFDEIQQQFFAGDLSKKDYTRDVFTGKFHCKTVDIQAVFAELLQVTKPGEDSYFLELLKDRVDIVKLSMQGDRFETVKRQHGFDSLIGIAPQLRVSPPQWQEDTSFLLKKMLEGGQAGKGRQIMNITEVDLNRSYNFYHDPYPEEARLIYEPMIDLLIRLRDIVIRDEYESPLLNESMFLANYIITCFNSEQTPLMKLLTSMEFLLTKLEEWESTYASRRLNSVEAEIATLKMLIIRYRKVQILSWRNLLAWRKDRMVREDIIECCRLAHTLEKQVFDLKMYTDKNSKKKGEQRRVLVNYNTDRKGAKMKTNKTGMKERTVVVRDEEAEQSIEAKMFELLDLFMRDSSLGVYESRLLFLAFLKSHFAFKLASQYSNPEIVQTRMNKVINILAFVFSYYGQFEDKLKKTVERLDSAARTKVKTLIDVSKWTVQKFTIVKNNIDKTHRQLNRACKDEEQALLQNVQSLVLASSRKKYATQQDQLLALHPEHDSKDQVVAIQAFGSVPEYSLAKQITFMANHTVKPLLPNANSLAESTANWMERMSDVRAVNKKNIQVRAYYDLLRFMKVQGLTQSSFNSSAQIQQLLVDEKMADYTNGSRTHFFKAFETYTMLQSASQVDEFSHIKNAEVLRMQAFSRSLMVNMLQMSKQLVEARTIIQRLADIRPTNKLLISSNDGGEDQDQDQDAHMTEARLQRLVLSRDLIQNLVSDTRDRLGLLALSDEDDGTPILNRGEGSKKVRVATIVKTLDSILEQLKNFDWFGNNAISVIYTKVLTKFEKVLDLEIPPRYMRLRLVCESALKRIAEIRSNELDQILKEDEMEAGKANMFEKNAKQVETLAKLTMQKLIMTFRTLSESDEPSQRKASLTAENSVNNMASVAEAAAEAAEKESVMDQDTSIEEMLEFSKSLVTILRDEKSDKLALKARQVFLLRGLLETSDLTRQRVEDIRDTMEQITACLQQALQRIDSFWHSMTKFSYLSQRVFIHLIYQGFCGQEDKDEPEEEPPSDLEADGEQDGCGLGDGKGGQNNITDQIEHEEQLEGLKDYESDQEQEEEDDKKDDKDDKNDEEEDNDFEMKNDFDGSMDDEPQDENPEDKKEDDEDDAMDEVDDMLDNQLWDQNMEDMEQKEKEEEEKQEEEKKENREVDLGDRDLEDQNLLPPDKNDEHMAEGDDEQQEQEPPKKEQQEPEDNKEMDDAEENEDDQQDDDQEGERDEDEEEDGDDVPLDKNPLLGEDDENFEEEAKSELAEEPEEDADKENTDEVDSKFEEEQGADEDDPEDQEDGQEDENIDDVQQAADQAVLDDDQIQAQQEEDKKQPEQDQANLKRQNESMQDQKQSEENKQNQSKQEEENQVSQADAKGNDLLFDLSKQLQKRQEQKQAQKEQQKEQHKQQKEDKDKQQVDQPQMAPDEEEEGKRPEQQQPDQDMNDAAAEFIHDDQAEMIQGKLATDQVDDEKDNQEEVKDENKDGVNEDMPMDDDQEKEADDAEQKKEENIERTQAQFKETGVLKHEQKEHDDDNEDENMQEDDVEEQKEDLDLLALYDAYLKDKIDQRMNVDEEEDSDKDEASVLPFNSFQQNLGQFDYQDQKVLIRQRFFEWLSDERNRSQSLQLLAKFKNQTQAVSSSLCEQLRIVLEPQLSQNLQGDFKTGKRLNMKKVISFIASHYRNDKIWLRRTLPSKRDYKILIAIDDSMSMRENNQGFFSLEAMIALTEALNRLEVGKVAVARIRERMDLVHSFDDTYTAEKASFIVSQFEFEHQAPTSADSAMANFVCDANKLLDMQNGGNTQAVNCPFVIILSDGRFNKDNVRRYIREAKEKRYLYIFVILDKQQPTQIVAKGASTMKSHSILNMRHAVKQGNSTKLMPYLRDFPFDYYCIVGDTSELPNALGTILVQWFSMVSAGGSAR